MHVLKPGSRGDAVRLLEQKLKKLGHFNGTPDDTFDKRTRKAVVEFKTENGWDKPKGTVGGRMVEKLGLTDAFEKIATPKTMKGGTYNAEIGRDPQKVKAVVESFLKKGDLDFLQLQEISGYDQVLKNIPGYKLITFPKSKDHGETGVLVKEEIAAKGARLVEAETGWTNQHGRPAQPRGATSVQLAGWLRVVSVHAPPGIDWKNGRPVGGEQRIESYQSLTRKLLRDATRNPKEAVLIGGDWNEGARTGGPGSPSWLAAKAGMKKYANGSIDWEMARGAKLSNLRKGPDGGSDHRLVTFTVSKP
jgi:peptidoglycan hydrolase-like protein with peptidoglycan-binding domain